MFTIYIIKLMNKMNIIIFIILCIFLTYNLGTVENYDNYSPPLNYNTNIGSIYQIHWIGRFGNRMFQYAFGCHYANTYNCYYQLPSKWEGTHLFKPYNKAFPIFDEILQRELKETKALAGEEANKKHRIKSIERYGIRINKSFKFIETQQRNYYGLTNIYFDDLHMMYFPHIYNKYNPKFIKSIFQFNENVINSELYQEMYKKKGTYDCAHIRRGDIVTKNYSGAHSAISIKSYHEEMKKQGIDPKNVIYVSDDKDVRTKTKWDKYCKDKWSYPEGQHLLDKVFFDWFPDFLTMYFSRKLFRGNSSISWWAGFLGDCEVYAPVVTKRITSKGEHFMESQFVKGNHPHFMGAANEGMYRDIHFLGKSN
jgi:hypothetical protein